MVPGLVSITAGCGNMECGSAVATGFVGGLVYQGDLVKPRVARAEQGHKGEGEPLKKGVGQFFHYSRTLTHALTVSAWHTNAASSVA